VETVGSFDAKTHFPRPLDRVAHGEEIAITKHGKPVAKLVPATPSAAKRDVQDVVAELKAFSQGNTLGGLSAREMIEDGRRN